MRFLKNYQIAETQAVAEESLSSGNLNSNLQVLSVSLVNKQMRLLKIMRSYSIILWRMSQSRKPCRIAQDISILSRAYHRQRRTNSPRVFFQSIKQVAAVALCFSDQVVELALTLNNQIVLINFMQKVRHL
jgi:hypothetical protein